MQTQLAIAVFVTSLVVTSELRATDDRRPRATTVTAAVAERQPESGASISVVVGREQPEKPVEKKSSARSSPPRTSIGFLVPDQSMNAWIEPVGAPANVPAVVTDKPALRIAGRGNASGNTLVVVDAERTASDPVEKPATQIDRNIITRENPGPPVASTIEVQPASPKPQAQQREVDPSAVFAKSAAEPETPQPTPVVVQVQPESSPIPETAEAERPVSTRVELVTRPVEHNPAEEQSAATVSTRLTPAAPPVSIPRQMSGNTVAIVPVQPQADPASDAALAESEPAMPARDDRAIQPTEQKPASTRVASSAAADRAPLHRPQEPVKPELEESLALEPIPMGNVSSETMADSDVSPPANNLPRRFPARITYRAPEVAPSPSRGYFVPQTPSIPFGGHGRQPGMESARTARVHGRHTR